MAPRAHPDTHKRVTAIRRCERYNELVHGEIWILNEYTMVAATGSPENSYEALVHQCSGGFGVLRLVGFTA